MKKRKKVLVTGTTGFIGSHLVEELIERNYQIIALKRSFSDTWRLDHLKSGINFYDIDKQDLKEIFENNKDIFCVFHLATDYVKFHQSLKEVESMIRANILLPSLLLELCLKYGVKKFINTGTFFEYRLGEKKKLTESSPIMPYNFYAATKTSFENHLTYYTQKGGIKGVTLKLFAPYGEKDNEKLFNFLIKTLLEQKQIEMTKGEQKWNFTYVKDIVAAYLKALSYLEKMPASYDSFNIGTSKAISLRDLVRELEKISKRRLLVNWGARGYHENEIFYVNCDNSKAEQLLNWKPKYDIKKGLENTFNYYLNNFKK